MPFDFKKEYKEFYLPPAKPQFVHIPKMNSLLSVAKEIAMTVRENIRKRLPFCMHLPTQL